MFNFFKKEKTNIKQMSKDILKKIQLDFGPDEEQAIDMINKALEETSYLRTERVVRCIIFLAEKNLDKLSNYINCAKTDTRDVMLWAEYINISSTGNSTRVRDFNKKFHQNDLTITQ